MALVMEYIITIIYTTVGALQKGFLPDSVGSPAENEQKGPSAYPLAQTVYSPLRQAGYAA